MTDNKFKLTLEIYPIRIFWCNHVQRVSVHNQEEVVRILGKKNKGTPRISPQA